MGLLDEEKAFGEKSHWNWKIIGPFGKKQIWARGPFTSFSLSFQLHLMVFLSGWKLLIFMHLRWSDNSWSSMGERPWNVVKSSGKSYSICCFQLVNKYIWEKRKDDTSKIHSCYIYSFRKSLQRNEHQKSEKDKMEIMLRTCTCDSLSISKWSQCCTFALPWTEINLALTSWPALHCPPPPPLCTSTSLLRAPRLPATSVYPLLILWEVSTRTWPAHTWPKNNF